LLEDRKDVERKRGRKREARRQKQRQKDRVATLRHFAGTTQGMLPVIL